MNITEVRVFPVDEDKLKAFASIVIDDAFVISDIKVIEGRHGRFLSMPSTRRKNGTFRDIAHPLNNETRRLIEERVFERYDAVMRDLERLGTPAGNLPGDHEIAPPPQAPRHRSASA